MKVRSTHCVELILSGNELAKALGHPGARLKEAEVKLTDGRVEAIRLHFEYEIATRGHPRRQVQPSSARAEAH